MKALLAFDTSNYRTSVCLLAEDGTCLYEKRQLLEVAPGARGLRQQEAVFQHLRAIPVLMSDMPKGMHLLATAASTRPRPVEGSYMPVFEVGRIMAETIASLHAVPFYATSHQEGHIAAALQESLHERFWAVHLSGGTSELLDVHSEDGGFAITAVGGTLDLHAGQLIDRVGVRMGCPFPAGLCLEHLAQQYVERWPRHSTHAALNAEGVLPRATETLRPSLHGAYFHLSGAENYFTRQLDMGEDPQKVAFYLLKFLNDTLTMALDHLLRQERRPIVLSGGVVANRLLRHAWQETFEKRVPLYLAPVAYAGDNALGVARIALKRWRKDSK